MSRLAIIRMARELRQRYRLHPPIDIERLCQGEGIDVDRWPLSPHIREMIYEDGIAINERERDPDWRRFLIAHAVGHAKLHAGTTEFWRALPTGDFLVAQRENQANLFARHLCINGQKWDEHEERPDSRVRLVFGVPTEAIRAYREDIRAGNFDPLEFEY